MSCQDIIEDCGCSPCDDGISPVYCADPERCEETYTMSCIEYPATLKCSDEADDLYPDVIHYLVPENATDLEKRLPAILNNYSEQMCYILSKDFIKQFLQNILSDTELITLYCDMICNIEC